MLDILNAPKVAPVDDDLFDLLSPSPFADILADEELATVCPYHGPHEVDEDGDSLPYCERCERRAF